MKPIMNRVLVAFAVIASGLVCYFLGFDRGRTALASQDAGSAQVRRPGASMPPGEPLSRPGLQDSRGGRAATGPVKQRKSVIYTPIVTLEDMRNINPSMRTRDGLHAMIGQCDPKDFEGAWELVEESGLTKSDKNFLLRFLCNQICGSDGFELVFTKLAALGESGEGKNALLREAFGVGGTDIGILMKAYGVLEYDDERKAALQGIAEGIGCNPEKLRDLSNCPKLGEEEMRSIGEAIGNRLLNVDQTEKAAAFAEGYEAIKGLMADGKATPSMVAAFLEGSAKNAPIEAWDAWTQMKYGEDVIGTSAFEKVPEKLVLGLVNQGGDYAMRRLIIPELAGTVQGAKLSGLAFYNWLGKDMNGASEWIANPPVGFSGLQADFVYQATVQYNIEHGQPEAAREWASRISDAKLREDTMGVVEARNAKAGK